MIGPTGALSLPLFFDALAITVGALSGALYATRKGFDIIGTLAVAFATGLGGGVIRDIVLVRGTPAFLTNPSYLMFAVAGSVIGFLFARRARTWQFAYDALDVAALGVWVVIGCQKAFAAGLPGIGVLFVGVLASVGGGLLRDLLCGDVPSALRPGQWYAFAAFMGAVTFVSMAALGAPSLMTEMLTLIVAALFRWSAARYAPSMKPMDITARWRRSSASA